MLKRLVQEKTKMLRFISFAHLSHAVQREISYYKIGSTLRLAQLIG